MRQSEERGGGQVCSQLDFILGRRVRGKGSLVDGSGVPPKTEELHRACRSARLLEGGWDVRSLQLGSSVPVMGITGS